MSTDCSELSCQHNTDDVQDRLLNLSLVMDRLLGSDPDDSSRQIMGFVRLRLKQFGLASYYSESDILVEAYIRTYLKVLDGRVIDNIPGWLRAVAFNVIREHKRKRVRDKTLIRKNSLFHEQQRPSVEAPDFINPDAVRRLVEALDQLSQVDLTILTLRIVQGLSWQQVREHLLHEQQVDITVVTLRQKGTRALNRLRRHFE